MYTLSKEAHSSAQKMLKSVKNGSIKRHVLTDNNNYHCFDSPRKLFAADIAFRRMLKTKNYSEHVLKLNTPQSPEP